MAIYILLYTLKIFKHIHVLLLKLEHNKFLPPPCSSVDDRSYGGAGDGQVHENPEWEKARQALASINKSQSSAKTAQANRTATAEVCFYLFECLFFFCLHLSLKLI